MDKKWDVAGYPLTCVPDVITRNENIDAGFDLCERCEGTGNEFKFKFRRCTACGGTGKEQDK
ncbi:MAG TPA: hypothetical protein ENI23_06255 [bacterium]|nr:hypothetical protein [bacterium]